MFQSKKPNLLRGIRHARKFHLRMDASRDVRCSRALNTQLPRVNAERAIHHVIVMDGQSLVRANETYCWQVKSCPLTKNTEWSPFLKIEWDRKN